MSEDTKTEGTPTYNLLTDPDHGPLIAAVKAAYEATGLKPKRYCFITEAEACPIGVLALVAGEASSEDGGRAHIWAGRVFGTRPTSAFESGFDGAWAWGNDTEEGKAAHRAGVAVARALFGEGEAPANGTGPMETK